MQIVGFKAIYTWSPARIPLAETKLLKVKTATAALCHAFYNAKNKGLELYFNLE